MKLRLFFTTFACLSATLFACAKPTDKEKIDKVRYEITYRTKSIIDTTKVDSLGNFIYNEEDMRLDVGEQVSFFYSYSNALYEQQRIEMMNKGNFSVPNMRGGSISWKLFKNFPTGKTTYIDNVFRDGFRVVEPIEQPQWELIPDSTARILDYNCQMARCNYKGRQWFAVVYSRHSHRQRTVEIRRITGTRAPCIRQFAPLYLRLHWIEADRRHTQHGVR